MNRRRTLLSLLSLVAAPPLIAAAPKRVVVLTGGVSPESVARTRKTIADFLAAEGLVAGRDYQVEIRNLDERSLAFPKEADDIVASRPDVIALAGTGVARMFQARTDRIPIVFRSVGDPVGAGLVRSLAQPGGNITGEANHSMFLEGKRLQVLRELQPRLRRVLVVSVEGTALDLARERLAAESGQLGIAVEELVLQPGSDGSDYERIFARLEQSRAEAILFWAFHVDHPRAADILATVQARAVPALFLDNRIVRKGGLVSLGVRQDIHEPGPYRILARVIRGESPANIPVHQTMTTHMAFNLGTARAMHLKVPDSIRLTADELID